MATVSSQTRSTTITLASATAGPFNVGIRIFDNTLRVSVNGVVNTDFTVAATYADGYSDDAAITFDTALEIGDVVIIDPLQPFGRDADYSPTEPNLAAKLNIELGRVAALAGDLFRDVFRVNDALDGLTTATATAEAAAQTAVDAAAAASAFDPANYQPIDSTLTDLSGETITTFAKSIFDDPDAAAARTTLGAASTDDLASAIPPGTVVHLAMAAAPTGYLKANGAAVSRATYAALFAAIGTTFGAGDGSTTFNVPELRGEFLRGLDDGRGVDTSRALGSAQSDEFASHDHIGGVPYSSDLGSGVAFGAAINAGPNVRSSQYGAPSMVNDYPLTSDTGGTETRPRNIALLACIKF